MRLHCINCSPAPVAVVVDDETGEVAHVPIAATNAELLEMLAPRVDVPSCERLTPEEETRLQKLEVDYQASKDPNKHYEGPNGRGLEQVGIQRSLFPLRNKKAKQTMCDQLAAMKSPASSPPSPSSGPSDTQKAG